MTTISMYIINITTLSSDKIVLRRFGIEQYYVERMERKKDFYISFN